jgi:ectoine hydroxylase-related dioxygenase (phytanoyl-CoA dioxygenase family)
MSRSIAAELKTNSSVVERIAFGSDVAEVARIVARDGGVVLTGALTRDEVEAVNSELDVVMGPLPQGTFGKGEDNFIAELYGRHTKRLQHCVKYSKTYREAFLGDEFLSEYVAAVVPGKAGSHSLFAAQAIEICPGEKVQELHRDGKGFLQTLGINSADAVNVVANTLLALTDVTEEIGATRVIPGSHLWGDFTKSGTQEQTVPATMNAGDMLFYNGKLLHGGGANTTKDRSRRVMSTAFSISFLTSEEAWPFVLSVDEVRAYPRLLQAYLGFHSVAYRGEQPGFLWRADSRPLEDYLGL